MVSVRTCLLSRKKAPKNELLRFVQQAGKVVWDKGQNLPGRGVYVTPDAGRMTRKVAVKAWERALRVGSAKDKDKALRLDAKQIELELCRVAEMLDLNLK